MGWRGVTWHTFPPSVTKKTVHLGFFRQVSQSSRDPQSSPEQIASGQGGNLVFLFKFENPPPPQKKKTKNQSQETFKPTYSYQHFLGRALRLQHVSGPSAVVRTG